MTDDRNQDAAIGFARGLIGWHSPLRRTLRSYGNAYRQWRLNRALVGPRLLAEFAVGYPKACFIQIGSNDGVEQDSLRTTIVSHDWNGILVEPVPYLFASLKRNYERYDRIRLENVAIADRDGKLPFYHLPQTDHTQEGLPRWYDGLGSFKRDVILTSAEFIPDIERRLITTQVPTLTFDTLCKRNNVDHVDLLQIDTEGYDYELLKLIDLKRYRPRLLIYEHKHLSATDRAACLEYLASHGYDTMSEMMDTWAVNLLDLGPQDRPLMALWNKTKSKPRPAFMPTY
jgi:FkbM family methyltransferase